MISRVENNILLFIDIFEKYLICIKNYQITNMIQQLYFIDQQL